MQIYRLRIEQNVHSKLEGIKKNKMYKGHRKIAFIAKENVLCFSLWLYSLKQTGVLVEHTHTQKKYVI